MTSATTQPADIMLEPPPSATRFAHEVNDAMAEFIASYPMPANLRDAIEYAVLNGGKRLRPVLTLMSCEAVGGTRTDALRAGVAVELIHAFSLVHDDLPAMDDDDLRRGRPTLHIAQGEAMAILAGDMMMGLAFAALATSDQDAAISGALSDELAQGCNAMIAGQVYDTLGGFPDGVTDLQRLELIHRNKTGALIRAACRLGALSGLAEASSTESRQKLDLITTYAESIGLMFQIVDDLLDVEQSAEHIGKGANKDESAGKLTYPGLIGADASRAEIERLRQSAINALEPLGDNAAHLRDLCEFLAVRTK